MVRKLITRRKLLISGALVFVPVIGLVNGQAAAQRRAWRARKHASGFQAYGPSYDRPFLLGQVTDSFWETQQTNGEAADFIFHDHEFVNSSAQLTPAAKRHLEMVALRIEHVPFPIVIERSQHGENHQLDDARKRMITEVLSRLGVPDARGRIVIAESFAEGLTATEAEQAYIRSLGTRSSDGSGRFGGTGGTFR